MSLPGRAKTLVKPIIALYSQNQALANLRHASSATYAGWSWLEEMHWLVETDRSPRRASGVPESMPVTVRPTARADVLRQLLYCLDEVGEPAFARRFLDPEEAATVPLGAQTRIGAARLISLSI